jgi:hypothetical protein
MPTGAVFELLATIFSWIAVVMLIDQCLSRLRPYTIMWALGLLFYGVSTAAGDVGISAHWSVGVYAVWYYFGGILSAISLGLGTLYLLGPRKVAHFSTAAAAAISVYAAVRILTYTVPATIVAQMAKGTTASIVNVKQFPVLPSDITACAMLMNIPGAMLLFGGAAWSAWTYWRSHQAGYRVVSMMFIALGAVFPGVANGLLRFGVSDAAQLGDVLGAIAFLAGFVVSVDVFVIFRIPFTQITLYKRKNIASVA